ncbi:hypothetical protein L1049_001854 [Liquidambar formosana]|uniref:Homeobox-leucine zipper protein n=1 Tax=Liquidambar formosana TaxID=63359 RepID=A0AAP0NEJ0_LIQFO
MAFLPADFMFQTHHEDDHSPSTSLNILPSCSPQDFHGFTPLHMKRSMSFSGINRYEELHGDDDLSDDGSQAGEKKRRLNLEQVRTLEKSFELGNKLEPERKMQLARALGLRPRQVAIWFQNRRARWKTKQLEKDYDILKKQFEAVKADNDTLQAQNKKLHAELLALKGGEPTGNGPINIKKETEGSWSNGSDNSSDVNLEMSKTPVINCPVSSQLSHKNLFPSSLRPTSITQLLQGSSRSDLQCPKIDHIIQDESFCNMFSGIDDQPGIWPWPEQ